MTECSGDKPAQDGLRILLVAEEAAGLQALKAVAECGHEVVAVLTSSEAGAKRGATVADVAGNMGVEVWPAKLVEDPQLAACLHSLGVDLLLNIHSLCLIAGEVVGAPRIGSFNLHPGPLPEYAGLNCPSWGVYNRESTFGVTLHWMNADIDAGRVAYQATFPIGEEDTGLSVSIRCVREGQPLIRQLLADASAGTIPAIDQDLSRRRLYLKKDRPNEGRIVWWMPADEIDAYVRAADYHPMPLPWGVPLAVLEGTEIEIGKVMRTGRRANVPAGTIRFDENGDVCVAASDEWLAVKRIWVDGRRAHPADVLPEGARLQ